MVEIPDLIKCYDRQGDRITDFGRLSELMMDRDYCVVGQVWVGDYEISTVWLGYAQSGSDTFETALLTELGGFHSVVARYRTEQEAIAGHWWAVYLMLSGRLPDNYDPVFHNVLELLLTSTEIGEESE